MSLLLSAFLAAFFASFASGIVGSYVVIKRIVFLSGSIAHSVLGGIGLFLWLNRSFQWEFLDPLYGAFLSAIISALLMGWVSLKFEKRKDAVIAAIWSVGMSLGVIFLSMTPGYNVELSSFLFGNILWISTNDLWVLMVLDLFLLLSVGAFYSKFLTLSFDENNARLQKISVNALYLFLLVLVAVSVVLLIQVIGIILVITLLTLPAMIASHFVYRLSSLMILSIFLSIIFSFLGIILSYILDFPMGATIALVCALFYIITLFLKKQPFSYKTSH